VLEDSGERPEGTERWRRIYHCRDVEDENVVVSFGFFEGDFEELRETERQVGRDEQVSSIEPLVEEMLFDGSFEWSRRLPLSCRRRATRSPRPVWCVTLGRARAQFGKKASVYLARR
jgi:hypothetical protein